jgi:hypothetical protein
MMLKTIPGRFKMIAWDQRVTAGNSRNSGAAQLPEKIPGTSTANSSTYKFLVPIDERRLE